VIYEVFMYRDFVKSDGPIERQINMRTAICDVVREMVQCWKARSLQSASFLSHTILDFSFTA
jgi:hypothetical protein